VKYDRKVIALLIFLDSFPGLEENIVRFFLLDYYTDRESFIIFFLLYQYCCFL